MYKTSMNKIQNKDHRLGTYEIDDSHCLVLMTKYISKTMDMKDQLLVTRDN